MAEELGELGRLEDEALDVAELVGAEALDDLGHVEEDKLDRVLLEHAHGELDQVRLALVLGQEELERHERRHGSPEEHFLRGQPSLRDGRTDPELRTVARGQILADTVLERVVDVTGLGGPRAHKALERRADGRALEALAEPRRQRRIDQPRRFDEPRPVALRGQPQHPASHHAHH